MLAGFWRITWFLEIFGLKNLLVELLPRQRKCVDKSPGIFFEFKELFRNWRRPGKDWIFQLSIWPFIRIRCRDPKKDYLKISDKNVKIGNSVKLVKIFWESPVSLGQKMSDWKFDISNSYSKNFRIGFKGMGLAFLGKQNEFSFLDIQKIFILRF